MATTAEVVTTVEEVTMAEAETTAEAEALAEVATMVTRDQIPKVDTESSDLIFSLKKFLASDSIAMHQEDSPPLIPQMANFFNQQQGQQATQQGSQPMNYSQLQQMHYMQMMMMQQQFPTLGQANQTPSADTSTQNQDKKDFQYNTLDNTNMQGVLEGKKSETKATNGSQDANQRSSQERSNNGPGNYSHKKAGGTRFSDANSPQTSGADKPSGLLCLLFPY